jgi:hypothetical protein
MLGNPVLKYIVDAQIKVVKPFEELDSSFMSNLSNLIMMLPKEVGVTATLILKNDQHLYCMMPHNYEITLDDTRKRNLVEPSASILTLTKPTVDCTIPLIRMLGSD